MRYTADLKELSVKDVYQAGGKAANLGELSQISGISVPSGYCILNLAFNDFLGEDKTKFEEYFKKSASFGKVSGDIKEEIFVKKVSSELEDQILSGYRKIGHLVAVRSSAVGEDSKEHAFAGLGDTKLRVDESGLMHAVKECWASLYSERSLEYRRRFDLPINSMAIVVQEMIHSDKSGIMFTYDHVFKNKDLMIIEASWGYGESIVGGRVSPDRYRIRKDSREISSLRLGSKKVMTVDDTKNKGTTEIEFPLSLKNVLKNLECLSREELSQLIDIGLKIESHYNHPQDIEWAIDGQLYITQSRPVTTVRG